ncbi:MAG: hypothetical protein AAF656_07650 [Planctomycetota bacterium]
MRDSSDPSRHKDAEHEVVRHVEALIAGELGGRDRSLAVDTRRGRLPVVNLQRDVNRFNQTGEHKRLMVDLGVADFDLQERLPRGEVIDVSLVGRQLVFFPMKLGHLRVLSLPPARELVQGVSPAPLTTDEVKRRMREVPPPAKSPGGPSTVVVLSTSGFTPEARQLATTTDGRTTVLVEPDVAGGWLVHAPDSHAELRKVLNPEGDTEKRRRVRAALEKHQTDLITGGVSLQKVATELNLPASIVEAEAKAWAKQSTNLRVKKLDGVPVLYREGLSSDNATAKGPPMAMMDKLLGLFGKKGDVEKKVAYLSERRAALTQQRDGSLEEIGVLEQKEAELREEFKDASKIARQRITAQLVQLRKDIARKQQLMQVLNQQVNVVGTHLHNLELLKQGQTASLPDVEEIAEDAAKAEEVLADLQAGSELADSVLPPEVSGMTSEEQSVYEELMAEIEPPAEEVAVTDDAPTTTPPAAEPATPTTPAASPSRAQPEAG